jgi:hypothetical protein
MSNNNKLEFFKIYSLRLRFLKLAIRTLVGKVRKGGGAGTRMRLLLYVVGEDVVWRWVWLSLSFPFTFYACTLLIIDYVLL